MRVLYGLLAAALVTCVGLNGREPLSTASYGSDLKAAAFDVRHAGANDVEPSQATSPKTERLAQQYLALLERYRLGDSQAVDDIAGWKDADIHAATDTVLHLKVGRGASRASAFPGEIAARTKAAAVMLHTEVGLAEIIKLGKPQSLHLNMAYAFMRQTPLKEFDSGFDGFRLRNWVLAVVKFLVDGMEYDPARSLLGIAGPRGASALISGTDRDLILTAGWVEESAAFYGERALTRDAPSANVTPELGGTAFITRGRPAGLERLRVRQARERAEKLYRRVLQLDAAFAEARLRLGRILFDQGRAAEATDHLRRVLTNSREARQRCLAALFLGAVREKEGDTGAAVELYSMAVAADPRSQAARVALSAALARTGQSTGAREAIAPLAVRRAVEMGYMDPWAGYVLGHVDGDPLSELRRLAVKQ